MSQPFCLPRFHRRKVGKHAAGGFLPTDVIKAYGFRPFPSLVTRTPVIGILELGGGYNATDNALAFAAMGQPVPNFMQANVGGAKNSPGDDADGEVALDIQVAAGVCQYLTGQVCKVVMVWAPNDGGANFATGIDAARGAHADATSISWGAAEPQWSTADRAAVGGAVDRSVAAGIPVLAAAGDNNSGDGLSGANTDFPASYPGTLGCGGTSLVVDSDGLRLRETVWNNGSGEGTGGGYSKIYPHPLWQVIANAMRLVPDFCGNADPQTGYRTVLDGNVQIIGGTSAVAPLWAGILAACRATGWDGANLAPLLYANPSAFFDTITGNNGQYQAGPGLDPCTGLGSPSGNRITVLLAGNAPPVSPPPPVLPPPPPPPPPVVSPLPSLVQWNAEFLRLFAQYPNTHDRQTLESVRRAGAVDLGGIPHIIERAATFPVLTAVDWQHHWLFLQWLARGRGPAAVSIIEAFVADLPLTAEQNAAVDKLVKSLLSPVPKAP